MPNDMLCGARLLCARSFDDLVSDACDIFLINCVVSNNMPRDALVMCAITVA